MDSIFDVRGFYLAWKQSNTEREVIPPPPGSISGNSESVKTKQFTGSTSFTVSTPDRTPDLEETDSGRGGWLH